MVGNTRVQLSLCTVCSLVIPEGEQFCSVKCQAIAKAFRRRMERTMHGLRVAGWLFTWHTPAKLKVMTPLAIGDMYRKPEIPVWYFPTYNPHDIPKVGVDHFWEEFELMYGPLPTMMTRYDLAVGKYQPNHLRAQVEHSFKLAHIDPKSSYTCDSCHEHFIIGELSCDYPYTTCKPCDRKQHPF